MFVNPGLVLRAVVAALFLAAGIVLLKKNGFGAGAGLIAAGGALSLAGGAYGLAVLRPFVGREFDDEWYIQLDTVDALTTFGLLACAIGVLWHAIQKKKNL